MALFKKGGGGFLNGVDGTIVGYKFNTKEWESKKKGGSDYSTLSVQIDVLQDGADEPVQQFIPAGFFYPENQSISDDGLTLESDSDGAIIRDDTDFARFVGSMIEAGFPEADLEAGEGRNFEAMVNQRFTFKREVDVEGTKQFGKRKDKKDPKKEYNRDWLLVAAYLGPAEASSKKGGAKKTAAKPAAKPAPKGKAAKAEEADTDRADEAIVELVSAAKDNVIPRAQVSSAVVRYALTNKLAAADREALRKQLFDEDYLKDAAERGVISYNGKDKKQPIGLPE